jgi:hypothetical protein
MSSHEAANKDKSQEQAEPIEGSAEKHTFRGVGLIEPLAPAFGSLNYELYLKGPSEYHLTS